MRVTTFHRRTGKDIMIQVTKDECVISYSTAYIRRFKHNEAAVPHALELLEEASSLIRVRVERFASIHSK